MKPETITLPVADVAALVQLAWELTNHVSETDQSATGSIYGIEHAHKTIARVAVLMPARLVAEEAAFPKEIRPTPGTVEYDEETELMQEAADAMRNLPKC